MNLHHIIDRRRTGGDDSVGKMLIEDVIDLNVPGEVAAINLTWDLAIRRLPLDAVYLENLSDFYAIRRAETNHRLTVLDVDDLATHDQAVGYPRCPGRLSA